MSRPPTNAVSDASAFRVAVRVRPLMPRERGTQSKPCVKMVAATQIEVCKQQFSFDAVFSHQSTQDEVYAAVKPLVESCFDGYNSTVFAYGQTGTGKTFTMGTGLYESDDSLAGIVPRAVNEIFATVEQQKDTHDTAVSISYIEIYTEELRDLLVSLREETADTGKGIHIRENQQGDVVVMGATVHQITSLSDVLHCLKVGAVARHTGATMMNEASSRSHSVLTLFVSSKRKIGRAPTAETDDLAAGQTTIGTTSRFNFVDLAGSERQKETGNEGARFKESVHINSGLLALGNVISALASKQKFVPYRDSKLTRLLKDSLGGKLQLTAESLVSLHCRKQQDSDDHLPESV